MAPLVTGRGGRLSGQRNRSACCVSDGRRTQPGTGRVYLPFAAFWSAEPLCIAKWSDLSLLIKYCGSSLEA